MSTTLLEHATETPETMVSCPNCPDVRRLEQALEKLQAEFRCEVGYWKRRRADAVKRIEQLKAELDQSRGETRNLQNNLFGRKSEKSARSEVPTICSTPKKSRLPRRIEVRSLAMRDTVGAIIPICRSRKSSCPCRRAHLTVRIVESRP